MRADYYVLPADGRWKIHHIGKAYFYDTEAQAMQAAVDTACVAGKEGHEAQVLVRGEDGFWQAAWTYGQDPYPGSE